MDARLQELFDYHDIRKVLAEYCHGCDRVDQVRMADVYLENSWDDHGINSCPGPEFAVRATAILGSMTETCSHQLGQTLINLRGDEAGAETYFVASMRRRSEDGETILDQMGGRFVDTLRRTGSGWKIARRVCVREWSISHSIEKDWVSEFNFASGQRSNADPAAAALDFPHSGEPKPG